jgi:hypothetical protein
MIPEEASKKFTQNESVIDLSEENLNPAESINDSILDENSQDIDNLPIESIGSYARLDELLTDEEKDKTTTSKPGS